ncbi:adenine deaminase [Sulfurimonas sp.]|uniref:adenine deaminase n=1 Tax=Sulfurimonas sp. TaxID=2022749 RepID=UPI002AB02D26|nr:adenine deaminase [Sulfurimonas sp.]
MIIKANYIDINSRIIFPACVEIENTKIVSVTKVKESFSTFILPGFIDAHIHIESSMLIPSEFARLAVRHGTVGTVSDPHEIANVLGIEGVEFMLQNANNVNFHFNFGVSPCVPATLFETSGATLDITSVKQLLKNPKLNHLAEVMAFPSVVKNEPEIMAKIKAAKELNIPIDGHAPFLSGDDLKKYIDAGISTDHEASSYDEAKEKLSLGMKILIREGSAAKNYEALSPLIKSYSNRLMFCSDDKHPNDLLDGHINSLVVRSIAHGYDLFDVLKIACINPKEHYKLDIGGLEIGKNADFIEVKDLESFEVVRTYINGEVVYENSKTLIDSIRVEPINNFHAQKSKATDFIFESGCDEIEVIQVIDHELFTKEKKYHTHEYGNFNVDIDEDILKIAVINRYEVSTPAIGFVNGFDFKKGAIASSVAHDSHNIIVVGCSEEEMSKAVNLLVASKGGISIVNGDESMHLGLEIAGIMSNHDAFEVAKKYEELDSFVKNSLGSTLSAPFMTLSFMALLVIPEIKLSDKGLFDGREFHFIPTCSKGA